MLVKNGIPVEDNDVYCMLLPGETEHSIGKKGKKSNLRSPFEEGHVYDNMYEFQHKQTCEEPNSAELNFALTCQQCHKATGVLAAHMQMATTNPSAVQNLLKLQSQMSKELLECGVFSIISHSCTDCAPL